MLKYFIALLFFVSGILTLPALAYADCSSPAAPAGTMDYFTAENTFKFCNGTDWINMGGGGSDVASFDDCQDGEAAIYIAANSRLECPSDNEPDAFTFTDQTGMELSTLTQSNIVQIVNMDDGTVISVSGGGSPAYRICADATCSAAPAYTSSAGTIDSGQYAQLRLTSSASYETANSATLTVGDSSDQWSVTTKAEGDIRPKFDVTNTGNSQTYSGDAYSVTGSGSQLGTSHILGTVYSGKYYIEFVMNTTPGNSFAFGWIYDANKDSFSRNPQNGNSGWQSYNSVQTRIHPYISGGNGSVGDVYGVYINVDTGEVRAYRNGSLLNTTSSSGLNFAANGAVLAFMIWDNNKYTLKDPADYTYGVSGVGSYTEGWVVP